MTILSLLPIAVIIVIGVHSILFGLMGLLEIPDGQAHYFQDKQDRGENVRLPWFFRLILFYAELLPFFAGFACLIPWGAYLSLNFDKAQGGTFSALVTFALLLVIWYNLSPDPNNIDLNEPVPPFIPDEADQEIASKMKARRISAVQQNRKDLKRSRFTNLIYAFTGGLTGLWCGVLLINAMYR